MKPAIWPGEGVLTLTLTTRLFKEQIHPRSRFKRSLLRSTCIATIFDILLSDSHVEWIRIGLHNRELARVRM